jgi:hypothetical protein
MWLLDKLLRRVVRQGELIVTIMTGSNIVTARRHRARRRSPSGSTTRAPRRTSRATRKWGRGVYMDGRMDVIEGDIRDLIFLVHSNVPVEKPRRAPAEEPAAQAGGGGSAKLDGINWKSKSRRMPSTPTTSPGGSTSSSWTRTANIPALLPEAR